MKAHTRLIFNFMKKLSNTQVPSVLNWWKHQLWSKLTISDLHDSKPGTVRPGGEGIPLCHKGVFDQPMAVQDHDRPGIFEIIIKISCITVTLLK